MDDSEWMQRFKAAFEQFKHDVLEAVAKYLETRAARRKEWGARLSAWLNEHVKRPLPGNWRDELDAFLDDLATLGVNVPPAERAKLQRWFARHAHRRGNLPKNDSFLVRPSARAEAPTIAPEVSGPPDTRQESVANTDQDSDAAAETTPRPEPTLPDSIDQGTAADKQAIEDGQHNEVNQPYNSPTDKGQGAESTPSITPHRDETRPDASDSAEPQTKQPLPPPRAEDRARIQRGRTEANPNHKIAADAEKRLAEVIHSLADEVVIYWGEPIGAHGADVVSFNLRSKQVTLWDSKYRSRPGSLRGSNTFRSAQSALDNAVRKAREAIDASELSESDKNLARTSLQKGTYRTRTVADGNLKNSIFGNGHVRSE